MPEKDFYEKKLEDFNDVFSDILNVLLFHGNQCVSGNSLENIMTRSAFYEHGIFREQERDAKKTWMDEEIRLALFGLENQTEEDREMVFRVISSDGADYRDQYRHRMDIRRENRKIKKAMTQGKNPVSADLALKEVPPFHPVITIILFFSDKRWTGSRKHKDSMKVPELLLPYVPDYTINVFEISYLTEQQVEAFQSDFRYVAEFFVQNRREKEGKQPVYKFPLSEIRHAHELAELMTALTGEPFDFIEGNSEERRNQTMETIISRERKKGEARGISKTMKRLINSKLDKGKSFKQIVEECETDSDSLMDLYNEVLKDRGLLV